MNSRRWFALPALAVFFTVCFLLAASLTAPACLMDAAIAHATDGRLRIDGCEGTLWRGAGLLATSDGRGRTPIGWHVAPEALLRGEIAGSLTLASSQAATIRATPHRLDIGPLDATLPAAIIAAGLGRHETYDIGGTVRISTPGAALTRAAHVGRIDVEWLNARSRVIDVAPLGSYRARAESNANGGRIDLQTMEGPLELKGAGQWTPGGIALSLHARGVGPDAERITAWLRTMAPMQPDGSFRFAWPPPQRRGASS